MLLAPDYIAPEIIMARGHNHAVDYWSYGVLLYEMLAGASPFSKPGQSQMNMFKSIVLMDYKFPSFIDRHGRDLIARLLVRKVSERVGTFKNGYLDIRNHPFFHKNGSNGALDPKRLLKRQVIPPWIPKISKNLSASSSRDLDDFSKQQYAGRLEAPLTEQEQALFADF
jgi:protein kinase A